MELAVHSAAEHRKPRNRNRYQTVLPHLSAIVHAKEANQVQQTAESTLVSVTWRSQDGPGLATFLFASGNVSSRPMSQASAWQAALQIFAEDCVLEERFEGGRRWTRSGLEPQSHA